MSILYIKRVHYPRGDFVQKFGTIVYNPAFTASTTQNAFRVAESARHLRPQRFYRGLTTFSDAPQIRFAASQAVLFAAAARYQLDEFIVPPHKSRRLRMDGDWVQETPWVQSRLVPFWAVAPQYQLDEFRTPPPTRVWRSDGQWRQDTSWIYPALLAAQYWPAIEGLLRGYRAERNRFTAIPTQPQDAWIFTAVPPAVAFDPALFPAILELLASERSRHALSNLYEFFALSQPSDAWLGTVPAPEEIGLHRRRMAPLIQRHARRGRRYEWLVPVLLDALRRLT